MEMYGIDLISIKSYSNNVKAWANVYLYTDVSIGLPVLQLCIVYGNGCQQKPLVRCLLFKPSHLFFCEDYD